MIDQVVTESDICTACGLCCDGTLFRCVLAKAEEIGELRQIGFDLRPIGNDLGFTQPCAQLCGTSCGVYARRPQVCRTYSCLTLDALVGGEITRAEAMNRVVQARVAANNLNAELLDGETIHDAKHRLHNALNDVEGAEVSPRFKLLLGIVEMLLDRHFRHPDQRAFGAMNGD